MSGTNIFYNGVRMQDCELSGWDQSVDTMDSEVGVRFTRIRFTASSSLVRLQNAFSDNDWRDRGKANSPHILSSGFAPLAGGNDYGLLSDLIQRVSHDLSQPRKDFLLWIDSTCVPATVDESPNVPQNNQGRTKASRVIVAATGIIPVEATEKLNVGTGDHEYSESPTETQILRRHVIDANSGPKVSNVKIEQVAGGAFCKVTATFEICRVLYQVDSPDNIPDEVVEYDAQKAKGVIYNRWTIVDGMDGEGKVSHDISGKMCVKDHRYKANACRLFAFPFAFPYGRMVDRNYTISEDGLTLEYRFKFQHAGAAPPAYIRDYKATYVEETGPGLGSKGIQRGSMQIKVKGWYHRSTVDPAVAMTEQVQKAMLLRGAFTILYARIRGIDMLWNPLPGQVPKRVQMLTTTVSEQVGKPELDLNVTVQYTQQERGEFALRLANMGEPFSIPGYDPRWWPVDNEWGRMMSEDVANPFFRSAAVPYAAEGEPQHSDYCDIYIQPPYSQRHTLPRLTGQTHHEAETDGGANDWEWARLDGTPIEAGTTATITTTSNTSPINQLALTAYISKDLKGENYQASLPQRTNETYTGVSTEQRNGYTYVQWESELLTNSNYGKLMLPLSKSRDRIAGAGEASGMQSAVKIKLHAGIAKRVYSLVVTREGDFPDLPKPEELIQRTVSSTAINSEHLLNTELLKDGCELMPDGCTKLYTVHLRWTYGLENALFGETNDLALPSMRSPILKSTFAQDSLADMTAKLKTDMIKT
jgi:hypothetical protein